MLAPESWSTGKPHSQKTQRKAVTKVLLRFGQELIYHRVDRNNLLMNGRRPGVFEQEVDENIVIRCGEEPGPRKEKTQANTEHSWSHGHGVGNFHSPLSVGSKSKSDKNNILMQIRACIRSVPMPALIQSAFTLLPCLPVSSKQPSFPLVFCICIYSFTCSLTLYFL